MGLSGHCKIFDRCRDCPLFAKNFRMLFCGRMPEKLTAAYRFIILNFPFPVAETPLKFTGRANHPFFYGI
jgi:hypothetical protein